LLRSGRNAKDENIGAIGGRDQLLKLSHDGAAGNDCDTRKARSASSLDSPRTDRRQIEAAILRRFRRLN
jgi:hypothetical protein